MRISENLLLVEGETDKGFFTKLRDVLKLRISVDGPPPLPEAVEVPQVAVPSDVGGKGNNKQGVLRHLPTLVNQLADGSLKRLAVVLDADLKDKEVGQGFEKTFAQLEAILNGHSFTHVKRPPQKRGLVFRHADGLADLGVWIMPNNRDEGTFEDFLGMCVSAAEQALHKHAREVVGKLSQPKFRPVDRAKADFATWLAWQESPGRGLDHALTQSLFDIHGPSFAGLTEWLREVFK